MTASKVLREDIEAATVTAGDFPEPSHLAASNDGHVNAGVLLIVTQVYPPDPTAVGQHIADIAENMVRLGWRVIVYAASRGYDDPSQRYAKQELRNGVTVYRIPFSSFGKESIARRLIGQSSFMAQAILRGSLARGVDRVLVSTVPPFSNLGGIILSWIHCAPLIWWVMDLNPDQMIRVGKISPKSVFARIFDWINRLTLRWASAVVVLDEFMRDRVLAKGPAAGVVNVIPPWSHQPSQRLQSMAGDAFRRKHGLEGKCVVMYSGNHGLTNPMESVLAAAEILRDHPSLAFAFIGGGVRKPAVDDFIRKNKLTNALSLPYQPLDTLQHSLSAADVHVVSISSEAVGVSHSCKIYGAMAVGRPILALAPARSHVASIMASYQCGWTCDHGDVAGLVERLRNVAAMPPAERDSMGARGARAIADQFLPSTIIGDMCRIIGESHVPLCKQAMPRQIRCCQREQRLR